jgi:Uma2 family endonuclease
MTVDTKLITAEEFATMEHGGDRTELICGEIVTMTPPGFDHMVISANIVEFIGPYVRAKRLGKVLGEGGFKLQRDPDSVLAPDASYFQSGRLPKRGTGFPEELPDLVFEVVSPSDLARDVNRKVQIYLSAGVRMVCVVWPDTREIQSSTPDGTTRTFRYNDRLDFGDVIPDYRIPVAHLLD